MPTPDMVGVVEVSPRDGLQNEATLLATEQKVELITRLLDAGVRRIEAASFVDPRRVPAMADAEQVMAAVPRRPDVRYIGLVLNARGLSRAIDAGVDEVNYVVSATEQFARQNSGVGRDSLIASWPAIAREARRHGVAASVTLSVAFGCPYEGEVALEGVLDVIGRVVDTEPPDEFALADTIGVGVPAQVRALVTATRARWAYLPLRAHFHNTRNTGYANAWAAYEAGVRTLDASAGGMGGCPFAAGATGNIATEDLAYLLHRSGIATGLNAGAVAATGTWLGGLLGREAPAMLGRAGPFPLVT